MALPTEAARRSEPAARTSRTGSFTVQSVPVTLKRLRISQTIIFNVPQSRVHF